MSVIIYDVETLKTPEEVAPGVLGWQNPAGMGFGCAVAYDYTRDQYLLYSTEKRDLLARDLMHADMVVSFNGLKFDDHVVMGDNENDAPWKDRHLDLLLEVVRSKFGVGTVREAEQKYGAVEVHDGSIGLDGLAKGTLGLCKTAHGSKSPIIIREGRWDDVFAYNLNDVRLTRMIFEHAWQKGFVKDRNGNRIDMTKAQRWIKELQFPTPMSLALVWGLTDR